VSERIVTLDPRALGLKPVNIVWNGLRTRARRIIGHVALVVVAISVLLMTLVPGWEFMSSGLLAAGVLGVLYLVVRPNRRKKEDMSAVVSSPLVEMFASRREIMRKKGRLMSEAVWAMRVTIRRTLPACKEAGCIAIVERSLLEGIEEKKPSDGLLEEEPIIHGAPRTLNADTATMGVFALMGIGMVGRDVFFGMPSLPTFIGHLAMAVVMGFGAAAGWYGRWQLQYSSQRIAGPGWIRSKKWGWRKTWTVEDSILFVHGVHNDSRHILVRAIGPRGSLKFQFDSVDDEGFMDLWQRWTCSQPRLELINESGTS